MSEATELEAVLEQTDLKQYVTFSLGNEDYAVPMSDVNEIIRYPNTFDVPMTPDYLIGLTNLRGSILPVMCLRRLLNIEYIEATEATRVIVMNVNGFKVGFTVDRVMQVLTPDEKNIKDTDQVGADIDSDLVVKVVYESGSIIQILETNQLLDSEITSELTATHGISTAATAQSFEETNEADKAEEELQQLVCCEVDSQEYAFPLESTQEIVRLPKNITKVPNSTENVIGIMNLRGQTLPLVSLRSVFNLNERAFDENNRIVVVQLRGESKQPYSVGIIVDSVREVIRLRKDELKAIPSIMEKLNGEEGLQSICNIEDGKRTLCVIDTDSLTQNTTFQEGQSLYEEKAEGEDMSDMTQTDEVELEEEDQDIQLVVFRLESEEFGISINSVQEIIRIPKQMSKVPKTDSFIEGIINLRGNILPIVDMRQKFGMETMERHERQRIIVVNMDKISTGFIVDAVSEVLRVAPNMLEEAPELSEEQAKLMREIVNFDNRMIGVLTPDQLVSNKEKYKLHQAANIAEVDGLEGN